MEKKVCSKCLEDKCLDQFYHRKDKNRYESQCRSCKKDYLKMYNMKHHQVISYNAKVYRENNIDLLKRYHKTYSSKNRTLLRNKRNKYYSENKDKIAKSHKIYYEKMSDKIAIYQREYRKTNADKLRSYFREYARKRKSSDISFKIKIDLSKMIRYGLSTTNSKKSGHSIVRFLPYTIQELKQHLESHFESWMTWDNWGRYNSKQWDDQDSKTWRWQIDHIIPHSIFKYQSMEDENFKKCWALDNLRPLSAKQNVLDGVKRKRHK